MVCAHLGLLHHWSRGRGSEPFLRGSIPLLRGSKPLLRGNKPLLRGSVPLLRGNKPLLMLRVIWWRIHYEVLARQVDALKELSELMVRENFSRRL